MDSSRSDWWLVSLPESGQSGWVPADYLEKKTLELEGRVASPRPEPFHGETGKIERVLKRCVTWFCKYMVSVLSKRRGKILGFFLYGVVFVSKQRKLYFSLSSAVVCCLSLRKREVSTDYVFPEPEGQLLLLCLQATQAIFLTDPCHPNNYRVSTDAPIKPQ